VIEIIKNPFVYDTPEWIEKEKRTKEEIAAEKLKAFRKKEVARVRAWKEKKYAALGKEIGRHGGVRPGSGRKKNPNAKKWDMTIRICFTKLQKQILWQMGNGKIEDGVNKLISELI
jgi:hypothetical protein